MARRVSSREIYVYRTAYDTVLFLRSIYNQLHQVTNRIGLIIFFFLSFLDVIYELSNIRVCMKGGKRKEK